VAGSRSWRRRRSRVEWLLAHTLVNVAIIGAASLLILGLVLAVTDAEPVVSPALAALPVFVAVAVALFCGLGALLGALADSQDGVIAASNTVALPCCSSRKRSFPRPTAGVVPTRCRGLTADVLRPRDASDHLRAGAWLGDLAVLSVLAVAFLALGAYAIPRTD